MISRQIHKIYPRKEREALYQKWGIDLETKQRSRQVAKLLWSDARDMRHVKESAKLIAELVGFDLEDPVPKEIFGLTFTPQIIHGRFKSAKWSNPSQVSGMSIRWRSNMSTMS